MTDTSQIEFIDIMLKTLIANSSGHQKEACLSMLNDLLKSENKITREIAESYLADLNRPLYSPVCADG